MDRDIGVASAAACKAAVRSAPRQSDLRCSRDSCAYTLVTGVGPTEGADEARRTAGKAYGSQRTDSSGQSGGPKTSRMAAGS